MGEEKLERAHVLQIELGADTLDDLCQAMEDTVRRLKLGEMTKGCWGSPSNGAVYEYRNNPDMTHEKYFEEIEKRYPRKLKAA